MSGSPIRFATVERRSRHRLGEVERRIHILEGRMTGVFAHRRGHPLHPRGGRPQAGSDRPLWLTEIQAEDILEIRLRQLARLEGIRIEKELNDLREEHGSSSPCSNPARK
jgi:topoisomerase-4 subunit A